MNAPMRPLSRLETQFIRLSKPTNRAFHSSVLRREQRQQYAHPYARESQPPGSPHVNFYKTHGRALFKSLTLAFFSFQVFYWSWILFETEDIKDGKEREIKSLEGEVRLLEEGRRSHRPAEQVEVQEKGNKLLEEVKRG